MLILELFIENSYQIKTEEKKLRKFQPQLKKKCIDPVALGQCIFVHSTTF